MWKNLWGVKLAITIGIFLVAAGLVVPVVRTSHIKRGVKRAEADLQEIADAVRRFAADTGLAPARGRDGVDGELYLLAGPGDSHFREYSPGDSREGWLEDHLVRNDPTGSPDGAYANWKGPYLDHLGPDPWGSRYILVLYPMFRDDERDVIVVSAGPNRIMDSRYASPRDPVPAGDDLLLVIYDKSPEARAPIVPAADH